MDTAPPSGTLQLGPIRVTLHSGVLDGASGRLSPTERRLLGYLRDRAGQTISRERLLVEVWGYTPGTRSRTADTTFARLRKKIEVDPTNPRFLLTIHGEGYRLELPEGPAPTAAPPERRVAPQLPPAPPMLGRQHETAQLERWLAQGRWLTIHGPGGMGKTRLALSVAQRAMTHPRFSDGVAWVPLAPLTEPEAVCPAIARAVGISLRGRQPPVQQLYSALADRRLLLVLDNAEHLIEAVAALEGLIEGCPGLAAVVTSRVLTGVLVEQRLPLRGLGAAAVSLFVSRVQARRPGWTPTAAQHDAITARCAHVDGLPLAVEMLAAATRPLSGRLRLAPLPAAPSRHRTFQDVFDGSLALLLPADRAALGQLSALCSTFNEADAAAVAGVQPAQLDRLHDAALLRQVRRRWDMHPLIREHAAALLATTGDHSDTQQRHRAWFFSRLRRHSAQLFSATHTEQVAALEPAATDLLQATQAAARSVREPLTPEEAHHVGRWVLARAAEDLSSLIDNEAQRLGRRAPAALAVLRLYNGQLRSHLGRSSRRGRHVTSREGIQALMEHCALDDVPVEARVLLILEKATEGRELDAQLQAFREASLPPSARTAELRVLASARACRRNRRYDILMAHAEAWLEAVADSPDLWSTCELLQMLGEAANNQGRTQDARRYTLRALALAEILDNASVQATCLLTLAALMKHENNPRETERIAREGLALADATVAPGLAAPLLFELGLACRDQGRADEARAHLRRAEQLAERTQNTELTLFAHLAQGGLLLRAGEADEAIRWFTAAIPVVEAASRPLVLTLARANLAEALAVAGRYEEAVGAFQALLLLLKNTPFRAASVRLNLADTLISLGRTDEADAALRASAAVVLEAGSPRTIDHALLITTLLLLETGEREAATLVIATASTRSAHVEMWRTLRERLSEAPLPDPLPLDNAALLLLLQTAPRGAVAGALKTGNGDASKIAT